MKKVRPFWSLVAIIINLGVVGLCVGCGSPSWVQPESTAATMQATTVAFSATAPKTTTVALAGVTATTNPEPPVSTAISLLANTPMLTVTPQTVTGTDALSGSLASTSTAQNTPVITTTEATRFQIIAATLEKDALGVSQLVLPISLNQAKLQAPVQELIYLITDPLNDKWAETTIWRATLNDISSPTVMLLPAHSI